MSTMPIKYYEDFISTLKKITLSGYAMFFGLCLNFLRQCDQENSKRIFLDCLVKRIMRCVSTHLLRSILSFG